MKTRDNEKVELNIFRKVAKIFFKILYNLLTIICILLIAIIVMQKLTDSNRSIAGLRIFRVVSGSMIPRFNIGEVVICKQVPADEIELGDSIVYRGKVGDMNGKLIMHEVIKKTYDENNELTITAKGLLNGTEDPDIRKEDVLGVVVLTSTILTALYALATSTYGSFIIILILSINIFMSFKPSRNKYENKRKPKQLEEAEEDYDDDEYDDEQDDEDDEYDESNDENDDNDDEDNENEYDDEYEEDENNDNEENEINENNQKENTNLQEKSKKLNKKTDND